MTVETCFRIIFGLLAIGFAILAVHNLVTGRTPAAGRNVTRTAEPRLYWGAIGQHVIMAVALGAGAVLPIAGTPTPALILAVFGGQLFNLLVPGRNPDGGPRPAAGSPSSRSSCSPRSPSSSSPDRDHNPLTAGRRAVPSSNSASAQTIASARSGLRPGP